MVVDQYHIVDFDLIDLYQMRLVCDLPVLSWLK